MGENTVPDYNIIIKYFEEYINHYKELLEFQNTKLSYISKNSIEELNNSLSKEQALIMKGNSLEAKRKKMLENQGVNSEGFKKLIEDAPAQYSGKLASIYEELSKYIFEVKRINDEAMVLVKQKLTAIDKKTSRSDGNIYNDKGDKKQPLGDSISLGKNI